MPLLMRLWEWLTSPVDHLPGQSAASSPDSLSQTFVSAPSMEPNSAATLAVTPVAFPAERFSHIATWVFDLDNTLYPPDCDLWPKIDQRITAFLMHLFGLDGLSARALQKYYYRRYGTTLRGLMEDHAISAAEFLAFVHDIDRSTLLPNPALAEAIAALPGRKLILTNGSRDHALLTTQALGLGETFEAIFDIVDAQFIPKPELATYERFFERHAIDPLSAAIFEDIERNLVIPHTKGMTTVLVVPKPGQHDHREAFEIAASPTFPHVDFVTSDLETCLRDIAALPQRAVSGAGI